MTQTPMAQVLVQRLRPLPLTTQSAALGRDALLVLTFSLVTALSAQIAVPLPFSPVPLTGQTFGVLLSGALLGPRLGALAMLLYLAEGGFGLPFFAGGTSGPAKLLGPTGSYLLSYPLAAAITGLLAVRGWDRRPLTTLAAMLLGSLAIFALGAAQLSQFPPFRPGAVPSLHMGRVEAFREGVYPFLPGDMLKALLAAGLLPLGWKWIGRKG